MNFYRILYINKNGQNDKIYVKAESIDGARLQINNDTKICKLLAIVPIESCHGGS